MFLGKKKSVSGAEKSPQVSPRKFETNFQFENSVVALAGGEFFSAERHAIDRWVLQERSPYEGIGPSFQIVYEQENGEFVFIRYECCEYLPPTATRPELWRSTSAPRGEKISGEQAFYWLMRAQQEIPECLKHIPGELAARQPAAPPADRPFEYWAKSLPEYVAREIPVHKIDFTTLTQNLVDGVVLLVHEIRSWTDGAVPSALPHQLISLINGLRTRYAINPNKWWGDPAIIPPKTAGVEELPWPTDQAVCRQQLDQIKNLGLLPLLVLVQARRPKMGNDYYPNPSELQNALKALVDRLPDIERAAGIMRRELIADSQSTSDSETLPASSSSAAVRPTEAEIAREIVLRDMHILSDFDWKILTLLREKGFTDDQIEKPWAIQSLIAEWLEKFDVSTTLKTTLSDLKKHQWILSRKGNLQGGGYTLSPNGLLALELRGQSRTSSNSV